MLILPTFLCSCTINPSEHKLHFHTTHVCYVQLKFAYFTTGKSAAVAAKANRNKKGAFAAFQTSNAAHASCCFPEMQTQHARIHPREPSCRLAAFRYAHFFTTLFQSSSGKLSGERRLTAALWLPAGCLLSPQREGPALPRPKSLSEPRQSLFH